MIYVRDDSKHKISKETFLSLRKKQDVQIGDILMVKDGGYLIGMRNYPDVNGVFNDFGSDAMRWFLMSSPILRGGNLIVTADGIRDTVRHQ